MNTIPALTSNSLSRRNIKLPCSEKENNNLYFITARHALNPEQLESWLFGNADRQIERSIFEDPDYPLRLLAKHGLNPAIEPYKDLYIWIHESVKDPAKTPTLKIQYDLHSEPHSNMYIKLYLSNDHNTFKVRLPGFKFSQQLIFLTLKFIIDNWHLPKVSENYKYFYSFIVRSTTSNSLLRFDVLYALMLKLDLIDLHEKYVQFLSNSIKVPTQLLLYGFVESMEITEQVLSRINNLSVYRMDYFNEQIGFNLQFGSSLQSFEQTIDALVSGDVIKKLEKKLKEEPAKRELVQLLLKWAKYLQPQIKELVSLDKLRKMEEVDLREYCQINTYTNYGEDISYLVLLETIYDLKCDKFELAFDPSILYHKLFLQIRTNALFRDLSLLGIKYARINNLQILFSSDVKGYSLKKSLEYSRPRDDLYGFRNWNGHKMFPPYEPISHTEYKYLQDNGLFGNGKVAIKYSNVKSANYSLVTYDDPSYRHPKHNKIINFRNDFLGSWFSRVVDQFCQQESISGHNLTSLDSIINEVEKFFVLQASSLTLDLSALFVSREGFKFIIYLFFGEDLPNLALNYVKYIKFPKKLDSGDEFVIPPLISSNIKHIHLAITKELVINDATFRQLKCLDSLFLEYDSTTQDLSYIFKLMHLKNLDLTFRVEDTMLLSLTSTMLHGFYSESLKKISINCSNRNCTNSIATELIQEITLFPRLEELHLMGFDCDINDLSSTSVVQYFSIDFYGNKVILRRDDTKISQAKIELEKILAAWEETKDIDQKLLGYYFHSVIGYNMNKFYQENYLEAENVPELNTMLDKEKQKRKEELGIGHSLELLLEYLERQAKKALVTNVFKCFTDKSKHLMLTDKSLNWLVFIPPKIFSFLPWVKDLMLPDSKFHMQINRESFRYLPQLTSLALPSIAVSGSAPFLYLSNLQMLDLGFESKNGVNLSGVEDLFMGLDTLKKLWIKSNILFREPRIIHYENHYFQYKEIIIDRPQDIDPKLKHSPYFNQKKYKQNLGRIKSSNELIELAMDDIPEFPIVNVSSFLRLARLEGGINKFKPITYYLKFIDSKLKLQSLELAYLSISDIDSGQFHALNIKRLAFLICYVGIVKKAAFSALPNLRRVLFYCLYDITKFEEGGFDGLEKLNKITFYLAHRMTENDSSVMHKQLQIERFLESNPYLRAFQEQHPHIEFTLKHLFDCKNQELSDCLYSKTEKVMKVVKYTQEIQEIKSNERIMRAYNQDLRDSVKKQMRKIWQFLK